MAPQGGGIAVVEVGDRQAEPPLEPRPHVEAGPLRMHEVRRAAAAQDARAARRTGRVEADGHELLAGQARPLGRRPQAVLDLREAHVRSLDAAGRMLAQAVDEELAALVEERVVDRRAAEIDAGDDFFSG